MEECWVGGCNSALLVLSGEYTFVNMRLEGVLCLVVLSGDFTFETNWTLIIHVFSK